jgi:hypothetical protein
MIVKTDTALLSALLLFASACAEGEALTPSELPESPSDTWQGSPPDASPDSSPDSPPEALPGDVVVTVKLDEAGAPFGDLFRAVNLDAGKQMNKAADYARIERLMCPDPTECTPGPVRFWDKVNHGRFALESPISHEDSIKELHARGFPIYWSMMGVPAFLHDSCTGCVVGEGDDTYHFLREVELSASDPLNVLNVDIACTCGDPTWPAGPPSTTPVGGVSWVDYIAETTAQLLTNFDTSAANLRVGVWNEPDQLWWEGNQGPFVSMWCAAVEAMRGVLEGRTDVLLGGVDISAWDHPIGGATVPLMQAIQEACGGEGAYDFLVYHQYSESGKLLFEGSVDAVRAWGGDAELLVDVGEYASSLGYGADATSPCDPTAIAAQDGDLPTPTGEEPSAVLCDHRGAVEDVAMAAAMAGQDHGRLYRFEVWDWGTIDMVDSRMGLLTINNLPKPAATAFWMLSHLQGERLAVINQLGGAHPYHLLASREDDDLVFVVAAQNRTVTEQFVRGLLSQGIKYNEAVAPVLASCPAFQSDDPEASLSALAVAGASADELIADCPAIDPSLGEALAVALSYAAPRVGQVDEAFDLTIDVPGWSGVATRYRIDAHRNTFAESYRRWPNAEFSTDTFDFGAAEDALWSYMTLPLDEVQMVDGRLTIEVRPDSVTMLRIGAP